MASRTPHNPTPASPSTDTGSHKTTMNTAKIPTPESAKDKLRSRSHIPWMRLGTGGTGDDEKFNAPPPLALGKGPEVDGLTAADRARIRFAVKGNAILTGGAGGLALASARALLEHGASGLALLSLPADFNDPDVQKAISQLRAEFPQANIQTAGVDVTNAEAMNSVVMEMRERLGPLRILVCFAGVVNAVSSENMRPEEWRRVLDVNVTGSWFAAQAVGKEMIASKLGGRIVFISSISGHRVNYPQPQAGYNASKAAVLQMRASLAAEWAQYGIRVNSISPGYMDTVLNEGEALAPFREVWAARNPVGRMGTPGELVGPLVMLCSEVAGSYVNGADLIVDGGGSVF
ncbi:hypothetical protein VTO42DRAFT_8178 [Malbranchea cinnamomea]